MDLARRALHFRQPVQRLRQRLLGGHHGEGIIVAAKVLAEPAVDLEIDESGREIAAAQIQRAELVGQKARSAGEFEVPGRTRARDAIRWRRARRR